MTLSISNLVRRVAPIVALGALVISMNGTWATAEPAPTPAPRTASAAGSTAGSARGAGPTAAARSAVPDATDEPGEARTKSRPARKEITGKLNLNTATEEQLMLLPTVGPSKAERIITWRKKNGGFKRIADLRRVKGFGYKTFKRLEPFLDITGETTLALKR
jgi:competence ComEA-like helix-hairpin-helix protein